MSTPLTDRIEALTAQANATTGASDTTLTDAVGTLISGYGQSALWKTVTLEDSHERDAVGNASYWTQFLEIPSDIDNDTYYVEFAGNTSTSTYKADFILYSPAVRCNSRNSGASVSNLMSTSRSLWAAVGTTINIYKIGGLT